MPAKTPKQRRTAGMALAAKRGKVSKSKLRKPVKSMMKMSKEKLRHFAKKSKCRKGG